MGTCQDFLSESEKTNPYRKENESAEQISHILGCI